MMPHFREVGDYPTGRLSSEAGRLPADDGSALPARARQGIMLVKTPSR